MQVTILSVFLLLSSLILLFSTVFCDPNHHHNHNDFPWQNILSSLGIDIEKQTDVISNTEPSGDAALGSKEHYTSESTVEILKSETKDESETRIVAQNEHYASQSTMGILKSETSEEIEKPVVAQNGTTIKVTSGNSNDEGLGMGYKVGIPLAGILFLVCFWYCVCKFFYACFEVCCCGCWEEETQQVVVMQSNTVQSQQPPAGSQIILQQPIIYQQAPPTYDPQWSQPLKGLTQLQPHPMGQQQQYSPNSGYDNAGFIPSVPPPPYDTGKY